ncbi:hypothetical protein [Maridesulfovibrio sp.]|uniref:hypothetical protein n=1 Tax=Maridesulfovibrio sp. TaxID=2795000 RepID=UPI0039EE1F5E
MTCKRSIAIWPTVSSKCDCTVKDCPHQKEWQEPDKSQKADLHINVWRLPHTFHRSLKNVLNLEWWKALFSTVNTDRFLDFGFMVEKPSEIDCINIFIPDSNIKNKDKFVCDLSEKLLDVSVLSAVFNGDLSLTNSIAAYQHEVTGCNEFILHELTENDVSCEEQYDGLLIKIKIPNLDKKIYIRVRLNSETLKHCISQESLSNSFIQKFLSKVEITDFQLNEFRTLDKRLRDKIKKEGKFDFSKINAFFISNSEYDILIDSPKYDSCRYLENSVWKKYIDHPFLKSETPNGVLAYHWKVRPKTEGESKCELTSFAMLIKAKFESASTLRKFGYLVLAAFVPISLSLFANIIFEKFIK